MPAKSRWQIIELTSQRQLYEEGKNLGHCISSYGSSCRKGYNAIFSLRLWDESQNFWDPYLTIQVSLRSRSVVQARSIWNSPIANAERKILIQWAQANEISIPSSY